ncbi:UDP-2,3-diacylglucosamine pyrophosphatase [hydrothermal vent metagenome]|uniref:UDP-2,3-diacylglucosamine pyrophosphatase n=1 Tax=hydrothermal vent metagenome TaxID=652676 RepID=A0A3B1CGB1_9ZZZZ
MTSTLGLIAGKGDLPAIFAREAKHQGMKVVAITFDKDSEIITSREADETHLLGLGQAGKVIKTFHGANISQIAMIGKIDKRVIFKNMKFDLRALKILNNMKRKNDDNFMLAVVAELESEGFKIINQTAILKNHMPGAGQFTRRKPTGQELEDIRFAMEMARGIAALDIGQTVIVKDKAVLAVEAIEGTDEAIERGSLIARKGAIVVKVSKPKQDPRFDVPTVGINTVETMARFNATALAVEAGKTVVVNKDKMVEICDRHKIAFVAV